MLYSVRKTTKRHGNTNTNILLFILATTATLVWKFGINYLVIFCSSALLHLVIESWLALTGTRKSKVYAYGYKLPVAVEVLLRSMVEGPAFCVPAFFVADQFIKGNIWAGAVGAFLVVGLASFADRNHIRNLAPDEEPIVSRRDMTRPRAMVFLALINTGCIIAFLLIPAPYRLHAFIYFIAYSVLVMLFYLINYNLGVRMVEIYDKQQKKYTMPGRLFQTGGLAFVSVYEMALLISPAYWVAFYLGLFNFTSGG
jgi:hypothetical protein